MRSIPLGEFAKRLVAAAATALSLALAGSACTTTYTEPELNADEPVAEGNAHAAICPEDDDAEGCEVDKPVCLSDSDYGCEPGDG